MYSGITRGRVLNGELCAQRLQKLILSVFIYRLFHEDISHEDFSRTIGANFKTCPDDWREIFMKESVKKYR